MADRFDLESKITDTYNFVNHLNDLSYAVLENNLTEDELANALHGLAVLVKVHSDKLFQVFSEALKLDEYRDSTIV
jgi:hypothetical protein